MRELISTNPYSGEELRRYPEYSREEVLSKLEKSRETFERLRFSAFGSRSGKMQNAARLLKERSGEFAGLITREMGKPIRESRAEVEKCAWVCEYYAEKAPQILSDRNVKTDASRSWVSFQPLGPVLAVMPWNFPFWQVFRFAAPSLMAGNTVLLKHASNVQGCAFAMEKVFREAGFEEGCFFNICVKSDRVEEIIERPEIRAVTLTGSESAGKAVAGIAGRNLKKTVLELGGSNPFIVMKDANLGSAVETGIKARLQNGGQSCIAAKRFLVHEDVQDEYIEKVKERIEKLKTGDPMDESTELGPLANASQTEMVDDQVKRSVKSGAILIAGGIRKNNFYTPAILRGVTPDMPVFREEVFGPVFAFTPFSSTEEALELSNNSVFGLGVNLFTRSEKVMQLFIERAEEGAVFINSMVKSDPRIPFGGIKNSGYGRELSSEGILEFVNIKTVYQA